ncbi:DUF2917 domain-containing protein [Ramlibacter montanisoli]|uniref:DUF2917 domain-containing protein n=1 Tax=Ramlibacter montanisoli TaxID=2732512 RepID=A0A849KA81_9BURK|nr:DUF2917 domain-containing protein [Ramlibacter montanisoli]NNU45242.1 DUF2917 domain-containing protein [Ramlibacter montanisoli]
MRAAQTSLFHVLHAFEAFLPPGRASITPAPAAVQHLQKGATMVLPEPQGLRLEVVRGDVWITHDGDCKDTVLAAGERYTSDRQSRMLVHALVDATVRLH